MMLFYGDIETAVDQQTIGKHEAERRSR